MAHLQQQGDRAVRDLDLTVAFDAGANRWASDRTALLEKSQIAVLRAAKQYCRHMCDTLVRVTDDAVLFAKNSDRDPNESQVIEFHPATGDTNAVLLSRPWWLWGAEIGTNDHGVTIGNEAVFTRRVDKAGGEQTGMDLLRHALERTRDRHSAVEEIVRRLEADGQGGRASHEHPRFHYDNSFIVADPTGAVVLETAGRQWATEEVTGARSISNGLTIPGFAEKFADPLKGRVAQCASRRRRTTSSAGRAESVLDLMAALRDHGDGSHPRYHWANGALAAPCAHAGGLLTSTQSTASWVADVTAQRHWVTASSAPCTSLFKPLNVGPLPVVEPAGIDNRFDPSHLWWRHEQVHRAWVRDPGAFEDLRVERDELEQRWVRDDVDAAQAWSEAEEWEARAVRRAATDRRPPIVRGLWRRWDRQARVPS